jgi:hypothetical protein
MAREPPSRRCYRCKYCGALLPAWLPAASVERVLSRVSPGREGGLAMPHVPRFQAPDATWMGLGDHTNLAMLVGIALIGGFIIWQEETQLRVETPTGGWQTLVSPS